MEYEDRFTCIFSNPTTLILIFLLLLQKQKLREPSSPAAGHTAGKQKNQDSNPGLSEPPTVPGTTPFHNGQSW